MNMTKALKAWIVEHMSVANDASDDDFRKAASEALLDGTLTPVKCAELTVDKQDEKASELSTKLDTIADGLAKLTETLVKAAEKPDDAVVAAEKAKAEAEVAAAAEKAKAVELENKGTPETLDDLTKAIGAIGADQGKAGEPRVKGAHEMYDDKKSTAMYPAVREDGKPHAKAGQVMTNFAEGGRAINTASERDKAVVGAFGKFLCSKARLGGSGTFGLQALPDHDKELLQYAMRECKWCGASDGGDYSDIKDRRLTPREQKDLIEDATSGGFEAVPIAFDDMVIQTPLLNGELFPLVNTIPLDRGTRVEAVTVGQVGSAWGGIDATAVALFNTLGYVTAFNTTIHRWQGSIQVGLDFLSDTPIDFGMIITQQYGQQLLEDLDNVIANGTGALQPEGVMNKAAVTTIAWGGATSLGNYESLRFGVTQQEHQAVTAGSAVFCGTETSYQRARALPVGAGDARRLGGMDYDKRNWMERPYRFNNNIANNQIFYAILAHYRMYRRRGLTITSTKEGSTLVGRNEVLFVAMARYGGQLERATNAAVTVTAPA